MKERFEPKETINIDLANEDVAIKILESGTDEELEKLRAFYNLTTEKIELWRAFARLRRETNKKDRQDIEKRVKENPIATQEELSMGAYKESIEPQVRDAILNLRKKGYSTYLSGFNGLGHLQTIAFEENHLKHFQFPVDLAHKLEGRGVKIKVTPKSISFECSQYLELGELKKIWDEIESILPDLGEPAKPSSIQGAIIFRKKQKSD